jgi:hypothetical protein
MSNYNPGQKTALVQETKSIGHLLAAVAVLAFLAGKIVAIVAAFLLTISFIMIGVAILQDDDKVSGLIKDLREFRKLHLGAIALSWATNTILMPHGFWAMMFFVLVSFVIEWALLTDS